MATPHYRLFTYQQDMIRDLLAVHSDRIVLTLVNTSETATTINQLPAVVAPAAVVAVGTATAKVKKLPKLPKLRPVKPAAPWWKRFEKGRGR